MAKINIKEAIAKSALNKFDLNFPYLATQGFGMAAPSLCTEVLPRDQFKVNYRFQQLLAPLSTPAFVDMKEITRFFFVPMESIFPTFKDMYESSSDASVSSKLSVPQVTNNAIFNYFVGDNTLCSRLYNDGNIYYRLEDGNKILCDNLGQVIRVRQSQDAAWDGISIWYMYIDPSGTLQLRPWLGSKIASLPTCDNLRDDDGNTYIFYYAYNGAIQTPFQQGQVFVSNTSDNTDFTHVSLFADTQLKAFYGSAGASYSYCNGNWSILDAAASATTNYSAVAPAEYFTFEYTAEGTHAYDFLNIVSGEKRMYRLTWLGRYLRKVLEGLGYNINWTASDTTAMSALPIIAYLRVWYDFLYPSAYVQSLGWASFFHDPTGSTASQLLGKLKQILILPYRQDYYTAAWKQFMQVGLSTYAIPQQNATTPSNNLSYVQDANGNPTLRSSATMITEYGIKVLSAVTDWLVRNNVAGSRFFEQMQARFGVQGYDVDPTRSMYVDSCIDRISINEQFATTETDNQLLGERAGTGSAHGSSSIHFTNRVGQFGYFIAISMVMPDIEYYQGRDRQLQHLDKFSFFTPEFERTAMQAIRNDELFADYTDNDSFTAGQSYGGNPAGVFGFAHRYSEYKHGRGVITGDFRNMSRNVGLDAYHAFRTIVPPSPSSPLALGMNFLSVDDQYSRIFAQLKDSYNEPIDHFVTMIQFSIEAYRPMQTISEQLMIEEGGEITTVNNEGTQL